LKYAQDCRAGKCHLCGVIYRERDLCRHMLKNQKQGHLEEEAAWSGTGVPPVREEHEKDAHAAVQRLRFRIGRAGEARLLSHLEVKDAWVRALRRAKAPVAYSQGFHQQPRVTFSTACPVGEESEGDYMDVVLRERVAPDFLLARLIASVPPGLDVFEAEEVPVHGPSLMSLVCGFEYTMVFPGDVAACAAKIDAILACESVLVERRTKTDKRRGGDSTTAVDIRGCIQSLTAVPGAAGQVVVRFHTVESGGRLAKPKDILGLLAADDQCAQVTKRATRLREQPLLHPPNVDGTGA